MLKADAQIRTWPRLWAYVGLAWALVLAVLRFVGTERPVHDAEAWIGDLALGAIFAAPALVVLAARDRRAALVTAGVISIPLSVVLSVAGLPLLVPGIAYLVAAGRGGPSGDALRSLAIPLVSLSFVVLAVGVLLFGPRRVVCWQKTEYESGRMEVVRDRTAEAASGHGVMSQTIGPPGRGVVSMSSGCTDGAYEPQTSLLMLAPVAALIGVERRLVRDRR